MLLLFWVLLFLAAACLILLMPALWGKRIYNSYRDSRAVNCPETHSLVAVRFKAFRAAFTGMSGKPKLSLADCSRWPERASCDQACIPDAVKAVPERETPPAVPLSRRIAHLPTLVAAGAAWVLGVAWHSEYMFRSPWAKAVGFTDQQAHDLARTWMPHLLTVGACLLFSYGTAVFLMWLGKRSLWTGVETSVAMWVVIVAVLAVVNPVKTAPDFRWIEAGYTILAALLIGAIVGGVPRRVFLRDTE